MSDVGVSTKHERARRSPTVAHIGLVWRTACGTSVIANNVILVFGPLHDNDLIVCLKAVEIKEPQDRETTPAEDVLGTIDVGLDRLIRESLEAQRELLAFVGLPISTADCVLREKGQMPGQLDVEI
jgi:hypothetical protein